MYDDFIDRWSINTSKDVLHFLIKAIYVDNYDYEKTENYFAYDISDIMKSVNFTSLDIHKYQLPYFTKYFKEHYNIDLKHTTHIEMYLKI